MNKKLLALFSLILIFALVFVLPSCEKNNKNPIESDTDASDIIETLDTSLDNTTNDTSDDTSGDESDDTSDDELTDGDNSDGENTNDDSTNDNVGDNNTGDDNTGDDNTGDDNTGDDNTGDDNTGDDNTGDDNTGDDNTGDDNDGEAFVDTPVVNSEKPIRNGNKVTFGIYPQSAVTNAGLLATLNSKAADWTQSNGMWYCDVENNGNKYRGVKTAENGEASWFKYELITWTILAENDGKVLILCDMVIDASVYAEANNNYASSTIRAWLNAEFLNTAFGELQAAFILATEVDNGVGSADYSNGNPYLCENTTDKVFLLSKGEVKNSAYGFTDNTNRTKLATAYAIANGAYSNENNVAWWWLRTPTYDYTQEPRSDLAHRIKVDGSIHNSTVNTSTGGVAPAMWICFEVVDEITGELICTAEPDLSSDPVIYSGEGFYAQGMALCVVPVLRHDGYSVEVQW